MPLSSWTHGAGHPSRSLGGRLAARTGCTPTGGRFCYCSLAAQQLSCFPRVYSFSSLGAVAEFSLYSSFESSHACYTFPLQQRGGGARERSSITALWPFLRGALNEEPRGPHLWGSCLRVIVVHCVHAVSGLAARAGDAFVHLGPRRADAFYKLDARRERNYRDKKEICREPHCGLCRSCMGSLRTLLFAAGFIIGIPHVCWECDISRNLQLPAPACALLALAGGYEQVVPNFASCPKPCIPLDCVPRPLSNPDQTLIFCRPVAPRHGISARSDLPVTTGCGPWQGAM